MNNRISGNVVAVDTETTGLNPYNNNVADRYGNACNARIFCWAYFTDMGEWGFMQKTPKNLQWLKRLLMDRRKVVVFQNAKFDLEMLWFEGFDIFNLKAKVEDTMLMSKVMRSTAPDHNLKTLAIKVLGISADQKDEITDWIKSNKRKFMKEHGRPPNFSDAPIDVVKRRVLWDVETTFHVYLALKYQINDICPDLYETERQLMFVCADMELYGVKIDITHARKLRAQAVKDLARIKKDLDKLVCPLTITKKKKGIPVSLVVDEFNPGSNIHCPAAFEKLNIPLKYRTKPKKKKKGGVGKTGGGNWSFDEYAMIRYVSKPLASVIRFSGEEGWLASRFYKEVYRVLRKHKLQKKELLPPLILKYRQVQKMISTYYDHLINDCTNVHIDSSGREVGILHCRFNQAEAMTGRFSSSKPNLQNIPRLLGPRECFIPRKGRRNWHLDYEQVEMKFFVHFSKDEKMAKAIAGDIHRSVASEVYNIPEDDITKEQRKRAKGVNFGIIYGQGPKGTAETLTKKGLPTTEAEATRFSNIYHRKFPSVKRTTRELANELKQNGFVTNPFGRRYHVSSRFAYKLLNYMCQGTSADQIKKAMVEIWLWLRSENLKSRIIITVHDELILECPRTEEAYVVMNCLRIMQDLTSFFVPITVSADIVDKRWSQKIDPKTEGFNFAA